MNAETIRDLAVKHGLDVEHVDVTHATLAEQGYVDYWSVMLRYNGRAFSGVFVEDGSDIQPRLEAAIVGLK